MQVEAGGRAVAAPCNGCRAVFCDVDGASRAVCRDGYFVALPAISCCREECCGTSPGRRASDGNEAEAFDQARNELAVKGGRDEDADAKVAVSPGCEEEAAVPEDVDCGVGREGVGGARARCIRGLPAQRAAQQVQQRARYAWSDGEEQALLSREGLHRASL